MKRAGIACLAITLLFTALFAQSSKRDRAIFVPSRAGYIDTIRTALEKFRAKPSEPRMRLAVDFSAMKAPASVGAFTSQWHNPPISQGLSGMCWCFSTTSMLESEVKRQTGKEMKFSELFTVYWEYVEKAKGFVASRGTTEFGQGSQANAVMRVWKEHGCVPAEAYTGILNGQPFHDHDAMYDEMRAYLNGVKAASAWDEETVTRTIRSIMDHYLGAPPRTVTVKGKTVDPVEYYRSVVKLNPDDYVSVCSFLAKPWYEFVEYEVPDNWWHSGEYFNVPLNDFMAGLKGAVRKGYTVELWGDVSEPGLDGFAGLAVVPTFDIPSEYIDESARQFRFANGTTSDDHGIHIVGYTEVDGKDWYLIKDSGSGSRLNAHPGYFFYSEDYVKLKMLGYMVHRTAIPEIVAKMKK